MKTNFFAVLLVVLSLVSCKDDKKEGEQASPEAETPEVAVKQNFSVELDVAASKKDDFTLYYTEDNTTAFTGELAAWRGVQGDGKRETVVFDLSEEKIPTDIRLDFGMNKEQESVTLYSVKISYYGNEINFKGVDFFKFFIESKDFKTEFDQGTGAIKFIKTGSEYKTPFYYPRQELIDALKKLTTVAS
ncbi:hypothetical protein [Flavobacterium sedimenticola]|uniref:Lipoprotein n=1 Tax=Flavobacterium sedimenticola TaxID=3043286 RepID=A0ABT6XMB3_9FLAO|nr:hypothetical protein [Flavobacterium sedimenticola]MDI9256110.1 hypothetical protein [Flavobacterium sedimenticola]